ncbi:MAG: hypothetical protein ACRDY1_04165 [Acidimicrobiales bacterium]
MAEYKVVCVERRPAGGHHHIVGVGVLRGKRPLEHKTVKDVRQAIKAKDDTFFTVNAATGEKVAVKRHKCCGEKTIASVTGDTRADLLAALGSCNRLTWYMVR